MSEAVQMAEDPAAQYEQVKFLSSSVTEPEIEGVKWKGFLAHY